MYGSGTTVPSGKVVVVSPASYTRTIVGWDILDADCASRRNLVRKPSSDASSRARSLMATSRPRVTS